MTIYFASPSSLPRFESSQLLPFSIWYLRARNNWNRSQFLYSIFFPTVAWEISQDLPFNAVVKRFFKRFPNVFALFACYSAFFLRVVFPCFILVSFIQFYSFFLYLDFTRCTAVTDRYRGYTWKQHVDRNRMQNLTSMSFIFCFLWSFELN